MFDLRHAIAQLSKVPKDNNDNKVTQTGESIRLQQNFVCERAMSNEKKMRKNYKRPRHKCLQFFLLFSFARSTSGFRQIEIECPSQKQERNHTSFRVFVEFPTTMSIIHPFYLEQLISSTLTWPRNEAEENKKK